MLVIVSDLQFTDGTVGTTAPAGVLRRFARSLRDLACAASYRAGEIFRPIEQIDLLLLGDIFDLIRSTRWLAGEARPWHDPQSLAVAETAATIVGEILAINQAALTELRTIATEGVRIPSCDVGDRRLRIADECRVPVRIHYLVGNRDWMLHLPGRVYDDVRQRLGLQLGLANRCGRPFAHDPAECDDILETQRRHHVVARHGDIYDPLNFDGDRNISSLGDAITIELVGRFARAIESELADDLPAETLAGLREIGDVRPMLHAPVWIDRMLERTCPWPMQIHVKQIWDAIADRFLQLDYVRSRDSWHPVDLIDSLARVLKTSRRPSVGRASAVIHWLHGFNGLQDASYDQYARSEQEFRSGRARHVVYGHTQCAQCLLHCENLLSAQLAATEHETAANSMNLAAFFTDDEHRGQRCETLGMADARAA